MRTVHKCPLAFEYRQHLRMPRGAVVRAVQPQASSAERLCLWAEVTPDAPKSVQRPVHIAGTGDDLPDDLATFVYVATVQLDHFVWHVYVGPEMPG